MNDKRNYKTTLCRHFMGKGYCSMQNICRFAHGRDELRKHTDPYPHYLPPHVQISSLYKTQLCRHFQKGRCDDPECQFAHGINDLRSICVIPIKKVHLSKNDEFLFSILKSLEQVFSEKGLNSKGKTKVQSKILSEGEQIITDMTKSKIITDQEYQQCQSILKNASGLYKINFKSC